MKAGTKRDEEKIIGLSGTTAVPIRANPGPLLTTVRPSACTQGQGGGEDAFCTGCVAFGFHLLMPFLLSEVLGAVEIH